MGTFWSTLIELLQKFFVLYPPFPEQATFTFLSLKGVAYLIGIVCAIVVYEKMQIKEYRAMLAKWWFWLELAALAGAAVGYQQLFQIDSPTEWVKFAEYLIYFFINWSIALLVYLIIFLIPYDKVKSFLSLLRGNVGKNGGTAH